MSKNTLKRKKTFGGIKRVNRQRLLLKRIYTIRTFLKDFKI